MEDGNRRNLHYFEAASMRDLYGLIEEWQIENKKRLLSVSIERDQSRFCCIALTNPTEVMIVDVSGEPVYVNGNALQVAVTQPVQVEVTNAVDVSVVNAVEVSNEVAVGGPIDVRITDAAGENVWAFDGALAVTVR